MTRRKRSTFIEEQKAGAVRLAREFGSVVRAAKDLDLTEFALRHWAQQVKVDKRGGPAPALASNEPEELRRFRRKTRILEQERDFRIEAATYFAKQQDRPSR